MDRPYNTATPRCTRCEVNPRLPHQRWCRECLSHYQRQRRARQTATTVIQAEIQAMPQVTPAKAPVLSEAQRQALEEYQHAVHAWQIRRQPRQGWLPPDRTSIMVQLARRLEHARQRLAALGIDLKALGGCPRKNLSRLSNRSCRV